LYEPLAEEKGLSLTIVAAAPAPVRGHRELVSQALANLLDNAIKYSAPEGDPALANSSGILVMAGMDKDIVELRVCDRGPGIPAPDRARVVERFVRLEQSRSAPGSGLGLSLVAAVARLHGGELRLTDNDPGLCAVLALPRARNAEGSQ
jgi:signal transduction histidine kinase